MANELIMDCLSSEEQQKLFEVLEPFVRAPQ